MQVNYSRIKEIAGDDEELIKTLLQLFVDTFEKCIKEMEDSITLIPQEGDQEWQDANHELKGSAYNLGFEELGDYCKKVEFISDNPEEKEKIIAEYKNILGDVMEIIARIDI